MEIRNQAKLQAEGLQAQLDEYAPILLEPTDLQEELKYLDHTRALLKEWKELQRTGEKP